MRKPDVAKMKAQQMGAIEKAKAKVTETFNIPPFLARVRAEIQAVDAELVGLLRRRVLLAEAAELAKREAGMAVHDPARERMLVDLYTPQEGPERDAYQQVINVCRERSRHLREQASLPGPECPGDQEAPETRPEGS